MKKKLMIVMLVLVFSISVSVGAMELCPNCGMPPSYPDCSNEDAGSSFTFCRSCGEFKQVFQCVTVGICDLMHIFPIGVHDCYEMHAPPCDFIIPICPY